MKKPQKQKINIMVKPQVYALLLEYPDINYLSVQCAHSLEEAFALAKLECRNQDILSTEMSDLVTVKISLFACKDLEDLNHALSVEDAISEAKEKDYLKKLNIFKKHDEGMLSKVGTSRIFGLDKGVPQPLTPTKKPTIKEQNEERLQKLLRNKNKLDNLERGEVIKLIIKLKDSNSFKEHESMFTENEQSYIKDRLKKV